MQNSTLLGHNTFLVMLFNHFTEYLKRLFFITKEQFSDQFIINSLTL